jgi:hypothetical protein
MARPEEFPIKFLIAIDDEMDRALTDWRRRQPDLPNRTEAIRRLISAALAADARTKKRA